MSGFDYIALDRQGKRSYGTVEASTAAEARSGLREQGIYPVEVVEKSSSTGRVDGWNRVKKTDIAVFSRQLATLLEAGLPLVEALSALEEQSAENGALAAVIMGIKHSVSEGNSLSQALSLSPHLFPPVFVSVVVAGESSGNLEGVLYQLAELSEREIVLKNKLRSILAYPVLVSVIGAGIVAFLLVVVLPALTRIFVEMSVVLPLPTRMMLAVGAFFHDFWWLVCIGGVLIFLVFLRAVKTNSGRRVYDRTKLKLPVVGTLVLKSVVSRFCRIMGTLVGSGVPIPSSLDMAANVVGNSILSDSIERAAVSIKEGETITEPLRKEGILPPFVLRLISSGEESGNLEKMLFKIADTYDEEVSVSVNTLSSLLEPLMVILLGGVVGFIVLAVLLPIFEMNQIIG